MADQFLTRMFRTNPDFVFTVTRDFVKACQTPVLVLPDDSAGHSLAVAIESAMLAPRGRLSMLPLERHAGEDSAGSSARAQLSAVASASVTQSWGGGVLRVCAICFYFGGRLRGDIRRWCSGDGLRADELEHPAGQRLAPAAASTYVNIAKLVTGIASAIAHWRLRNIDRGLVFALAVPGSIGAVLGVTVLSRIDGATIRPYLAVLLTLVGVRS